MMPLLDDIRDYVMSEDPMFSDNRWFEDNTISIYLRRGRRVLDGAFVPTLEIANVSVNPNKQGEKVFTILLTELERIETPRFIYIENVLTDQFQKFFEKRGYRVMYDDGFTRSYIQNKS